MTCNYPSCRQPALWTPVVEIPTIRTQALIKPELSPLLHNEAALRKGGFIRNRLIADYERALASYRADVNTLVYTDQPTYLIGREVCQGHRDTYNLFNWIRRSEWRYLREAARTHGVELPTHDMIVVKFHPLGWRPGKTVELVRDRMNKEG